MAECPCGCGKTFPPFDTRGRPRKFYSPGCSLRVNNYMNQPGVTNPFSGRHHSDDTRRRLSKKASVPKPWIRGERNGMSGRTGSSNPNYKDGSSPERQRLYASGEGKALLLSILERDGWRCTRCGEQKRGPRSLHVHHVKAWGDYPELRFDPDNLVTLCRPCHHDAHRKEVVHQ